MEGAMVTMVTTLVGGNDTASLFNNSQNANFGTWNLCAGLSAFLIAIQLYLNRDIINSCSTLKLETAAPTVNCSRQQIYCQVPLRTLQTSLLFGIALIYLYWAAVHRFSKIPGFFGASCCEMRWARKSRADSERQDPAESQASNPGCVSICLIRIN